MTDLQTENEALKAQLHRERIDSMIEADVRARVCLPAARESFRRLFRLDQDASNYSRITPSDWQTFRASQPRPPSHGPATGGTDASLPDTGPDNRLVEMTRAYLAENEIRHKQLTGERLTFDRAAAAVARQVNASDPALLRSWLTQPGEI